MKSSIVIISGFAFMLGALNATSSAAPVVAGGRISTMRKITLGGVDQTILIRGADRANPVLLFLHGGPGLPEMPFSYTNRELERDFTVVHWDQRGAGKSFRPSTPAMNVEQFVSDTLELSRYLQREFGGGKILLVGHSWGSLIGALAVAREPQLFRAFVGIGQLVNIARSEQELDRRSLAVAREKGDGKALRKLQALGHFPYPDHSQERKVNGIQKTLMGGATHDMSTFHFAALALGSPYYSPADYVRLIRGIAFSGRSLEREIYSVDLAKSAPEIDVPVYLFEGRQDTVLSPIVAEDYLASVIAPRGKHLVWFERSNHWPQLEEREKDREALRLVLRQTKN